MSEDNKEDFKIESKGIDPFFQMEIAFLSCFDTLYRGKIPLEDIPLMCIEGFIDGKEEMRPSATMFTRLFFKKWKDKNGL